MNKNDLKYLMLKKNECYRLYRALLEIRGTNKVYVRCYYLLKYNIIMEIIRNLFQVKYYKE